MADPTFDCAFLTNRSSTARLTIQAGLRLGFAIATGDIREPARLPRFSMPKFK
jgi:hypothetical protein